MAGKDKQVGSRSNPESLFSGLVFWGSEFLPQDIAPSLREIREWAIRQGLIWDAESQLLSRERAKSLEEHFVHEDELGILIHLYKDSSGNLCYLEYPYLTVKSLIKRGEEVQIVYWQMIPTIWNADGSVAGYGEVHFGFWYPGVIGEEFCSTSYAKLVVRRFSDLFHQLSGAYNKRTLSDGVLDIEVDGDVKARFSKAGRLFAVDFTQIH